VSHSWLDSIISSSVAFCYFTEVNPRC
jgi:hypothetical protein